MDKTGKSKRCLGNGDVGLDIGTQTIAISSQSEVKLLELADKVQNIENKKQTFLTQEIINQIYGLKTQKAFEENIKKAVVTRAEKFYLLHTIKTLKLNDYTKNAFCENHCGRRIYEV